jgi:hypothetical protein
MNIFEILDMYFVFYTELIERIKVLSFFLKNPKKEENIYGTTFAKLDSFQYNICKN